MLMNILMIDTHSRTNAWRLGKKTLHDDEGSSCCRLVFRHFVLHTCVLYEKLLNQRCLDCIPFSKQNLTCCCSLKSICATALPSITNSSKSLSLLLRYLIHLRLTSPKKGAAHIQQESATNHRMCDRS